MPVVWFLSLLLHAYVGLRIVPALADEGVYLASESSMQRVLRAHGQTRHRGRAKAPRTSRAPSTHVATAPRQLWCWDMTYLPAEIGGRWFYLACGIASAE